VTERRPSPRSDAGDAGVTLACCGRSGRAPAPPASRLSPPSSPSRWPVRRGYAVGSAVLAAVLPANQGPTTGAPVAMDDAGLELRDGIEAKEAILIQLARAFEVIREHDPARIVTLGGECAVRVAPFSELARRYGDDLAIVWIDSHPLTSAPRPANTRGSRPWRWRR
jgi:arginase family enzyme